MRSISWYQNRQSAQIFPFTHVVECKPHLLIHFSNQTPHSYYFLNPSFWFNALPYSTLVSIFCASSKRGGFKMIFFPNDFLYGQRFIMRRSFRVMSLVFHLWLCNKTGIAFHCTEQNFAHDRRQAILRDL